MIAVAHRKDYRRGTVVGRVVAGLAAEYRLEAAGSGVVVVGKVDTGFSARESKAAWDGNSAVDWDVVGI